MKSWLLLAAWTVALAAAASVGAEPLPREDIRTFSQDPIKLQKLRDAVFALQQRVGSDPMSWFALASIHGVPANDPRLAQMPPDLQSTFRQCHRHPELPFVWHRAYVAAVERSMQAALNDDTFRIPYWDWFSDPSLPAAFREPEVDGRPNALYRPDRLDAVRNGAPVWDPVSQVTDFGYPRYSGFESTLFEAEHGSIHSGVGGAMANFETAANDPVFFLHHANIDRLLVAWIGVDPETHKVPADFPRWMAAGYSFPMHDGGRTIPTVAELAMSSRTPMDYYYESTAAPVVPAPAAPARPADLPVVDLGAPAGMEAAGGVFSSIKGEMAPIEIGKGATLVLPIRGSAPVVKKLQKFLKNAASDSRLFIVFDDVRISKRIPGVLSYRVFTELKETPDAPDFREHYAGTISLFELPTVGQDKPAVSVRMPLTERLLRQMPKVASGVRINVSLVPELAPWAPEPEHPMITIGEVRIESVAKD